MKKYKTTKYSTLIAEVECVRETEKKLVVLEASWAGSGKSRECMHAKKSEYDQYHDTWEAAHAFLMDRTLQKVEWAREALQKAQSEHGNVKGMKPPVTANA